MSSFYGRAATAALFAGLSLPFGCAPPPAPIPTGARAPSAQVQVAGPPTAPTVAAIAPRPPPPVVTRPMPGEPASLDEVRLVASMMYGSGASGRDVDHAARLLASRPELGPTLITHRFPLDAAAEAFACARDRSAGAIKVVLEP